MTDRLLFITSPKFGGGIMFHKVKGAWRIFDIPPYLRKTLRNVAVPDIGRVLTEKGFDWRWV